GKQFNKTVAGKHNSYLPLPQGSVCLLNKHFTAANLCDDQHLS
ncbi:uncharacterized protein ACA1_170780, partial [Acanthamoeba castellanii str. Neff]